MKKSLANYIILIAVAVTMLTPQGGVFWYGDGEKHKETYYNLKMTKVIDEAKRKGIEGEYWVRGDGCKMFGDYVIIAADYDTHPYGSTVKTSLGEGIVLDTGEFAKTQIDIATNW